MDGSTRRITAAINAFASADRFGAADPGGTRTYSAGLSGGLDLFTGGRRIADLRRAGGRC
jgi:outer membrane protein TolC